MRRLVLVLTLAWPMLAHGAPPAWGRLDPGPYGVGLQQLSRKDVVREHSGPSGSTRMSLWYPVESGALGGGARDAWPARGPFPLVLYAPGPSDPARVTPEYLASHGYVVASVPRQRTEMRDLEFLIRAASAFPTADTRNIGFVAVSPGGGWRLAEVLRNPDVHAMVSLESMMLFDEGARGNRAALPLFEPDAVRVPVLQLIRPGERLSLQFQDADLNHAEPRFRLVNRYALAFFNAHLKHDPTAADWLSRGPEENGAPLGLVTASAIQGDAAPRSAAELLGALEEGSLDDIVTSFRREWAAAGRPPVSEGAVNSAAYVLLASGRVSDALRLFELNAEAHPGSANAYDSLAEACLEAGDTTRARELARRALLALEDDPDLTPERRDVLRAAASSKLAQLP